MSNEQKKSADPNNVSQAPTLYRQSNDKKQNTEGKASYPQLHIKTLTGKIFTIDYNKSDTILTVKTKIKALNSIPEDDQRLVLAGQQLENDKTLDELHIKEGTMIYLLLRLRGGVLGGRRKKRKKTRKKTRKKKGGTRGRNKKLGKPSSNRKQSGKKKKRTIRFRECQTDPDCEGTKVCRGSICVEEHQVPKNTRTNSERWELRHGSNLSKQMNSQSRSRERRHRFNIKSRVESKMFEEDRQLKAQGKAPLTEELKAKYRQMAEERIERDLDRMREENYRNIQRAEAQRRRRKELAARGRTMVLGAVEPATVKRKPKTHSLLKRTDSMSDQFTSMSSSSGRSSGRSWDDIRRRLEPQSKSTRVSGSEGWRMAAAPASASAAAPSSNISPEDWDEIANLLAPTSKRGGRKTRRKKRRRRKSRKRRK